MAPPKKAPPRKSAPRATSYAALLERLDKLDAQVQAQGQLLAVLLAEKMQPQLQQSILAKLQGGQ